MTGTAPHSEAPRIPSRLEDLTPAWVEAALKAAGALPNQHVSDLQARHVAAGSGGGFFSDLVWIEVDYNQDDTNNGAPRRLILKRPRTNLDPILIYRYEREVRYYQQFGATSPVTVPACYYAEFDPETGNFAILLEDLGHLSAGDQLAGCSLQEAEVACRTIARLHAAFMGDASVEQRLSSRPMEWSPPGPDAWRKLREDFAGTIPPAASELAELLSGGGMATALNLMRQAPQTLIHGDFRVDNMLFGPASGQESPQFVLLDWQMTRQDTGPADLALFLGTSLEPDVRSAWERDLVALYLDELKSHGVSSEYGPEDCLRDYRLGLIRTFASGALGHFFSSGGPEAINKMDRMVLRASAAVAEMDCLSLVKPSSTS